MGLIPSAALFAWIEHQCSLPRAWTMALGLPSLPLQIAQADWILPIKLAADLMLIQCFGVIHSWSASDWFKSLVKKTVPDSLFPTLYVIIAGVSAAWVMTLWQATGRVVWAKPIPGASPLFWILLAVGSFSFWGTRQGVRFIGAGPYLGKTSPAARLQTRGLYRISRHPLYLSILAAIFVTPFLSLDRACFGLGVGIYLLWAIPLEERKLVREFGNAYRSYQKQVRPII